MFGDEGSAGFQEVDGKLEGDAVVARDGLAGGAGPLGDIRLHAIEVLTARSVRTFA